MNSFTDNKNKEFRLIGWLELEEIKKYEYIAGTFRVCLVCD